MLTEMHVEVFVKNTIVHLSYGGGDNPKDELPRKSNKAARTLNRHRWLGREF